MSTTEKLASAVDKISEKRRALGRGLESLLPSIPRPAPMSVPVVSIPAHPASPLPSAEGSAPGDQIVQVALDLIDHNPYQTRARFDDAALQELAESIRTSGVVQPIVVRPGNDGRYVLVLGERRCRASRLAGKERVPAIVRRVSDQQAAEMTVVENLQRQDLNCLEQAQAFARLSREFGLTQEQIGLRTGVSRESVSNYMRLLKLPPTVQQYLQEGKLGFSEARVLLQVANVESVPTIAETAIQKKMSVAQLVEYVAGFNLPEADREAAPTARWVDPNVRAAQSELERVLGVRVKISDRHGRGKIVIEYASLEDYDRVFEMLTGKGR